MVNDRVDKCWVEVIELIDDDVMGWDVTWEVELEKFQLEREVEVEERMGWDGMEDRDSKGNTHYTSW